MLTSEAMENGAIKEVSRLHGEVSTRIFTPTAWVKRIRESMARLTPDSPPTGRCANTPQDQMECQLSVG